MNIGTNPTFDEGLLSIEIHFLDFNSDLYDQKIQISLLKYLRAEQKFASVALLKTQLNIDKNETLEYVAQL